MTSSSDFNESLLGLEAARDGKPALRLYRVLQVGALAMIVTADLFSLLSSIGLARFVANWLNLERVGMDTISLGMILPAFGGVFALLGLYRLRGANQVDELRLLTWTTTILFAILATFYVLMDDIDATLWFFAFTWIVSVVLFPLSRWVVRGLGARTGFWGEPVVVIGNGSLSSTLVKYLMKNTSCGMRPVLVVDGREPHAYDPHGPELPIPVVSLDGWSTLSEIGPATGVSTAIVVTPDLPASISTLIAHGEHFGFSQIITVSQLFNTRNIGLTPLDFGGIVGLEERHYELSVIEDWQIRIMDILLILLALPLLALLFLIITLAIRVDSQGPAFYRQTRIGKGARKFKVVKFRTMFQDADQVLVQYLAENPQLRAEWEENFKLKDDPRITRMGRFLRKTSLDELPQLWNVLKGEMSLVGPRPIVAEEIVRYTDKFKYYTQVPPGLTGLWQVSGRNDVDYEQRVGLDEYYVRNRSIWMNLHILVRTVLAVLRRHGAY